MKYRKRIVDKILKDKLTAQGAVLIVGPKWCGKTTTALQHSKSSLFMQDPQQSKQYQEMAKIAPTMLMDGETPRLIDEWQLSPNLWDAIRFEVDRRSKVNQFILTGSSVPLLDSTQHTGIGRISRMAMRPMSLYESGDSNGLVSLSKLFETKSLNNSKSEKTIADIAYFICRGGWPSAIDMERKFALRQAYEYVDGIIESEISRVDGVKRDKTRAEKLLKSYARNISTSVRLSKIQKDVLANDIDSFNIETLNKYINALKLLYVIEDQPAWRPNLRSKTAIRTTDTRHFVDPSIAVAALGSNPEGLLNDFNLFGYLFESMCIRDLRIYAEAIDGKVLHYRDKNGLEADAVIQLRDGRYGLVEVKLGNQDRIEEGAMNLIKLSKLIDTRKSKSPSFLMILTGTQFAYQREDGVYVVPITCLKD